MARFVSSHGPMIERLARLGYAAIGIVYFIVGGFAAAAGFGKGGTTGDQKTAFYFIEQQPFGRVALGIIALGLAGYVLWRFISAFTDNEHRGSDAKGWAIRLGSIARGAGYSAICVSVIRIMMTGRSNAGSEQKAKHWTAAIMDKPFGRWLVIAAGLGIVGYGAYQLYAAWDAKLSKRLSLGQIDDRVLGKVVAISRFGIGARGVVMFVIGGSLVMAGLKHNPNAAHGTSGALASMPPLLLGFVGLGLAAYGVYALVNARYRRITTT
ncbi:MAG TPA: DUF1206 domain-containing protein [Thermoanaerobaculia bacterium]|nr:DUF1206 domain-containing protein [Thermoanaerobaculia bacterium]